MLIILISVIAVVGVGIAVFILTSEKPAIPAVSPASVDSKPPSAPKIENPPISYSSESPQSPDTPE